MQCKWLGERVAAPSLRHVIKNALTKEIAPNWGPNATFRFPTRGGTGAIWTAVSSQLPSDHFRLGPKSGAVKSIDPKAKTVELRSGEKLKYGNLISTMALDGMIDLLEDREMVGRVHGEDDTAVGNMRETRKGLVWSSTIILGIGIRGERPERIADKCKSKSVQGRGRQWNGRWTYAVD